MTAGTCPTDETTIDYVQQRTSAPFEAVHADPGASYAEEYRIDVSKIEPLVAAPHSPDNRKTARECSSIPIDRVYIGYVNDSAVVPSEPYIPNTIYFATLSCPAAAHRQLAAMQQEQVLGLSHSCPYIISTLVIVCCGCRHSMCQKLQFDCKPF